jgi:hypothetical protein
MRRVLGQPREDRTGGAFHRGGVERLKRRETLEHHRAEPAEPLGARSETRRG